MMKIWHKTSTTKSVRSEADTVIRGEEMHNDLRALIELSPAGLFLVDLTGVIISANVSGARRLDRCVDDIIGTRLADYFPANVAENRVSKGLEAIAMKSGVTFDDHLAGRWYRNEIRPILDENGEVRLLAVYGFDITDQKKTLETLQASERQYRQLVESANSIIVRFDVKGRITFVNPYAESVFGYSAHQLLGRHAVGTIIPEVDSSGQDMRGFMARLLKDPVQFVNSENENISRTGERKWVSWTNRAITGQDGETVEILSVGNDITARKLSEESLRESEKKYRSILSNITEGYFEVDLSGTFRFFNRAMCDILGYDGDELFGMSNRAFMDENNAKKVFKAFNTVYRTGQPYKAFDWELIRKNGSGCFVETSVSLIRSSENKPVGFRGVARDVTERIQMEKDKADLEAQLRQSQKMEAIGTLAGGVAHEFNNILATIMGNSELAKEDTPVSNPVYEFIEEIYQASLRGREVVKQLLNFSQNSNTRPDPIQIGPLVANISKLLRSTFPANIEIRPSISDESLVVKTDPELIHQVIVHLCTNAAHAMQTGGGLLEIGVGKRDMSSTDPHMDRLEMAPGHYVAIRIRDNGQGIPEKLKEKIFDPFFTTKAFGQGSGMGLPVVRGIVREHGGGILVESREGKGTTVTVFMPLVVQGKTPALREAQITHGKENPHILLVDDEPSIAALGVKLLKGLGYRVTGRTDPLEALALFRRDPDAFDLVITDMTMPKLMGNELIREMHKIRNHIPVILNTGYNENGDETRFGGIQLSGFIQKPFDRKTLATMVKKVLDTGGDRAPNDGPAPE